MALFDIVYLQNKYVQTAILIAATYLAAIIFTFIIERFVYRLTAKTKTKLDDLILERTHKAIIYMVFLIGMKLAIVPLALSERVSLIINNILGTVIIFLSISVALAVVDVLINEEGKKWAKKTKSTVDDELLPIMHKTANAAIYILGFIFILNTWNIDVTGVLAGLGIAGIAIGFAVRDSLANIFGGISIILDKAYKVGDKIKLESGEVGIVYNIGLRSTRLKTFDNQLLTIPNSKMANSKIQNYTQPTHQERVNVEFGVEYGCDVEKVKKVVLDVIKKQKDTLKKPEPQVVFTEMGDFALKFVAKFWVDDYNKAYSAKLDATKAIYNALNKSKIGIPFPTQTIYVKK